MRQTRSQGGQTNDDLGCVAEGRVQEAADAMPKALGQHLGGQANQPSKWDESQRGEHKGEQGRRMQGLSEDRRRGRKDEQRELAIHGLSVSHREG